MIHNRLENETSRELSNSTAESIVSREGSPRAQDIDTESFWNCVLLAEDGFIGVLSLKKSLFLLSLIDVLLGFYYFIYFRLVFRHNIYQVIKLCI